MPATYGGLRDTRTLDDFADSLELEMNRAAQNNVPLPESPGASNAAETLETALRWDEANTAEQEQAAQNWHAWRAERGNDIS